MIAREPRREAPDAATAAEALETRVVRGDGVALAVTLRGPVGAPVIVLVHGYPDSQRVWSGVARLLAERYRVVTYDVRGAGRSEAPRSHQDYSLEHLLRDLDAVIDAVTPPGSAGARVHLVGHDWGSIQGWEAVTDPALGRKVKSFTSISGPCLDHAAHWMRAGLAGAGIGAVARQAGKSWYIGAMHAAAAAPSLWGAVLARTIPRTLAIAEGVRRDPEREATLASDATNGVNLYLANIGRRLAAPRERTTDVPVQVVAPIDDPYVSPAMTRDVQRWAPTVFRREVTGGHWQPLSHPDRVARWISELVRHVEGEGTDPSFARLRTSSTPSEGRLPRRSARTRSPRGPGRLVLVTGGASGIGRETCFAFAKEGADVIVADRDVLGAQRTAELCSLLGVNARAREVDVASEASMSALADAVLREDGVPDVLVLNAGIGVAGRFLDTTAKDWERILGVNVLGVIHGARLFGRAMVDRGQGGHVVVTASAAAFAPSKALPAYATTKAAVLMLAECLRVELAEAGVGVSAICPGFIDTPITSATQFVGVGPEREAVLRRRAARLYRRRGVGPHVVARAIVRAVGENRPIVPVAAEAHVLRALSRFAPGLLRRLGRLDGIR